MLHLLQDYLKENPTVNLYDFHFVHFEQSNEFEEVVAFRKQVEQELGISINLFGADFKSEVQKFIKETGVSTIIMGNRSTDPWSSTLQPFT